MRQLQLREILRDVDIACAIAPVVHKHRLTCEETAGLLRRLSVPRARSLAELVSKTAPAVFAALLTAL